MEQKKTVLIVEDEKNIVDIIRFNLQRTGYDTLEAYDGEAGLAMAREKKPDLILLDVMMPKMMGFDVCRALREEGDNVPVIILTAREEEEDKILGLEIGADDYLAKPFLPKELLLRVGAILSRAYPRQNEMVELAGATVDMANAEVWKNGEKQTLTAKEIQLFEKLYQNAGRIVTTGILCETICGEFWQGYESTLSTHIRHLREKIEENPSKPVSLVTVKGLGYRLNLKEVSP